MKLNEALKHIEAHTEKNEDGQKVLTVGPWDFVAYDDCVYVFRKDVEDFTIPEIDYEIEDISINLPNKKMEIKINYRDPIQRSTVEDLNKKFIQNATLEILNEIGLLNYLYEDRGQALPSMFDLMTISFGSDLPISFIDQFTIHDAHEWFDAKVKVFSYSWLHNILYVGFKITYINTRL